MTRSMDGSDGSALERDAALGDALRDVTRDETREVDWTRLRGAINARAATELGRRRAVAQGVSTLPGRARARRFVIPATIAAGLALFVLVARAPEHSGAPAWPSSAAGQLSIEELLDADVSDGQFQALVAGADEATDLLAIAADD